MKKIPLSQVEGAFLFHCDRYYDQRGFFQELYNETKYPTDILPACKQVSASFSKKHVFRGIHTSPYYKLVTCLSGHIVDIIVDFRETSPTYLKYTYTELKGDSSDQVFVPAGCGHAFFALEDSVVCYSQGGTFTPSLEMDVNYKDPQLNIKIPHMEGIVPIISEKDSNSPFYADARQQWLQRRAQSSLPE